MLTSRRPRVLRLVDERAEQWGSRLRPCGIGTFVRALVAPSATLA
ncbi:hypothetical protein [Streptomyces sp. CBMA156]|nr:hypothetical protein [Streptomyces sp. CBMA156]